MQTTDRLEAGMAPAMALALAASFGSVATWREVFEADPAACLCFDPRQARLVTHRVDGAVPLLSHADPQDWTLVHERYQATIDAASADCGASHDELRDALLLDVRRAGVFDPAEFTIPGARWRDPAAVERWAQELPVGREVVVYCVYGHEVGRATALRLRAAGLNARYLRGGMDAWQAAGLPLTPKQGGTTS